MDPCIPPPDHIPDPNAHHTLSEDGTGATGGVPEEFLHPCCQKDLQEKRVRDRVLTKVRAADRAAQALARRKEAVSLGGAGGQGSAAGLAEWARHRHEHVCVCVWMWVCSYIYVLAQPAGVWDARLLELAIHSHPPRHDMSGLGVLRAYGGLPGLGLPPHGP
jgi:hypothetical protein